MSFVCFFFSCSVFFLINTFLSLYLCILFTLVTYFASSFPLLKLPYFSLLIFLHFILHLSAFNPHHLISPYYPYPTSFHSFPNKSSTTFSFLIIIQYIISLFSCHFPLPSLSLHHCDHLFLSSLTSLPFPSVVLAFFHICPPLIRQQEDNQDCFIHHTHTHTFSLPHVSLSLTHTHLLTVLTHP